jgi:hypothetical protein
MWVYFSSSARLEEIRAEAEKRGIVPSKYLVAAEEAFRTQSNSSEKPATAQEIQILREENANLARVLKETTRRIASQDEAIRKLRGEAFLEVVWYCPPRIPT